MIYRLVVTVLFLFAITAAASAQTWREIVPLRSSCEDVKRILRTTACRDTTYDSADAKVTIAFSDGTCATGWKVKKGTVLFIEVHPKTPLKFEDLHLDEALYEKSVDSHLSEVTYYRNENTRANIAVFSNGTVASLAYGPSTKDKALQRASQPELTQRPRAHNAIPAQSTVAWKHFEVRGRVALMIPEDMESIEPFGDDVRYREAFRNKDLSITIASDLLSPGSLKESQKQLLFSCETDRLLTENPSYRESSIEIDGRNAKLGITKAASTGQLNADLCFASSDDSNYPLRIVAICKDEGALEVAMQIFRSIRFNKY